MRRTRIYVPRENENWVWIYSTTTTSTTIIIQHYHYSYWGSRNYCNFIIDPVGAVIQRTWLKYGIIAEKKEHASCNKHIKKRGMKKYNNLWNVTNHKVIYRAKFSEEVKTTSQCVYYKSRTLFSNINFQLLL